MPCLNLSSHRLSQKIQQEPFLSHLEDAPIIHAGPSFTSERLVYVEFHETMRWWRPETNKPTSCPSRVLNSSMLTNYARYYLIQILESLPNDETHLANLMTTTYTTLLFSISLGCVPHPELSALGFNWPWHQVFKSSYCSLF